MRLNDPAPGATLSYWLLACRTAIAGLRIHPLRSSLTMLGIFIGVSSVIWLLAIGEGISQKAREQIESLGATSILVRSVRPPTETDSGRTAVASYGIVRADVDRLEATLPTIQRIAPQREIRRRFRYRHRTVDGRLIGCTTDFAANHQLVVKRGRFLADADGREKRNVCVLAAGTAERLFPFEDPLDQTILVENSYYRVIGILAPRSQSATFTGAFKAQDFSNDVYIPVATFWDRLGDVIITFRQASREFDSQQISQINIKVDEPRAVLATARAVDATLKQYHPKEDYQMLVPLELLEQAETTRRLFALFMGLIAAVSLVVGGIGIMNIMLATVTERTREIGIRRALGAKRRDIRRQFLVETSLLSLLGGLGGVVGGLACKPFAIAARRLMERFAPKLIENLPESLRSVEPVVVPWSVPVALGVAVVVGLVFGLYPALRAAQLDPIEAIRRE